MAVKGNYSPYKFLQLLLLAFMFVPSLSLAPFRLNQGESLNASSSLVSENFFSLGFQRLGIDEPNNRSYLGIWIYYDPTNPFWIGNRDKPISDNSGMLSINGSGALKLNYSGGDLVDFYSSGQSTGNNLSAILRRDGNLILRDGNSGEALWESFDHPTDTLLPGMKLGTDHRTRKRSILVSWLSDSIPSPGAFTLEWNYTSQQLVVKRRGETFWTANMTESYFGPEFFGTLHNFSYSIVSNTDEDYFVYSVALIKPLMYPGQRDFTKLRLTYDGNIFDMNSGVGFLSSFWCDGNSTEHGCRRWEGPHCRNGGDKFDTRSGTFVASPEVNDNTSISISDCMHMCWKNCSCVATKTFHSNGTGCLFFHGNFTQDPSGSSPKYSIIIRPDMDSSGKKKRIWILPAVLAFAIALIMATVIILWYRRRRRNRERLLNELLRMDTKEEGNENENGASVRGRNNLKFYNLTTIMTATNNLSPENKLGQGGFGPVYKGKLLEGKTIAVKILSRSSGQGMLEFKNELILIAKLQHMNLVRLLGCCIHGEEKMLVYEYMPNKSLDSFIFDESKKTLLDWNMRLKIIEGIAQGMLYLHKYSRLKIIHRDLKASNILLDENFNPKISDFGIARIFKTNTIEANTDRVVGTYGYMSPEYAMRGVFSVKSDVFSFGVLMLEIISGKKNHTIICINESIKLVGYAWELWTQGNALELQDPILIDSCPKDQVLRCIQVGLLCVQDNALDRPVMSEVVTMLRCEASQIPSPKKPAFTDPGGIMDTISIIG